VTYDIRAIGLIPSAWMWDQLAGDARVVALHPCYAVWLRANQGRSRADWTPYDCPHAELREPDEP
jgi:hypothetical protein